MEINLFSVNIRFDTPSDGINSWDNRKKFLTDSLKEKSPVIIGTQEGRQNQLVEFSNLVNLKIIDSHRDWIDERMYPSLYFNSDLITLVDSGDIWLSKTPYRPGSSDFNSAFPRLSTYGLFKTQEQKHFFVFNVHLDHKQEETKIKQIEVLLEEINRINKENFPIILMGDFNTDPTSKVYESVFNNLDNIYDPWKSFNYKEESTYHFFQDNFTEGARIDWILLPNNMKCLELKLLKDKEGEIFLSDHFPVFCKCLI